MNDKKSFVLYADYATHINMLSDEDAGKLFKGIMDYAGGGDKPNFDGAVGMCFSFIAAQIDRDSKKYKDVCQKRAEAGRKGGLKKAEKQKGSKQYGLGYVRGMQEGENEVNKTLEELAERVQELEKEET